jgi:hypothetical protein
VNIGRRVAHTERGAINKIGPWDGPILSNDEKKIKYNGLCELGDKAKILVGAPKAKTSNFWDPKLTL